MNFSSSLMTGMGISLGDLEIATDYLFANTDFYEPELTEIKTTISNKPQNSFTKAIRSARPKLTKQSIINKFSLVGTKPILITDEIIDSSNIINNSDDFDFSFEEERNNNAVTIEEIDQIDEEESSELLEANELMKRIANMNNNSMQEENYNETLDDKFSIDDIEDIDIEDESEAELDTDDIDIESDIDNMDIEDFEAEDDDTDTESNIDNIEFDIDDEDNDGFELDEDDTVENISATTQAKVIEQQESDDDFEFELDDDNSDELNIEDSEDDFEFEVESDGDDFEFEEEQDTENEDSFEIEDDSNIDDGDNFEFDLDDDTEEEVQPQKTIQQSSKVNNENDKEIQQLKDKIATMEKQMHQMADNNAQKNTSEIGGNKNKEDDIDNLINANRPKQNITPTSSQYDKYTVMTDEQLFIHVRAYMQQLGVQRKMVDVANLNNKFGESNIKKLIKKSYLIKVGKGVTTGK